MFVKFAFFGGREAWPELTVRSDSFPQWKLECAFLLAGKGCAPPSLEEVQGQLVPSCM